MTAFPPRKRKQPKKKQNYIKANIGSIAQKDSSEAGERFWGRVLAIQQGNRDCEYFSDELSITGKRPLPCLGKGGHLSEIPTASTNSSSQELIPPTSSDGVSDLQVVFRQEAYELTANTGLLC